MSKVTEEIKIEMNVPIPELVRKSSPIRDAATSCPVGGSFVIPTGSMITVKKYVEQRGLIAIRRKTDDKNVRVWVVSPNGNGNGK